MGLDNREIALLTWFCLIGGTILWRSRHSAAFGNLLRLLFKRPILSVSGTIAAYVATCVWLLSIPGWWQWSNLKTTLLWTFGFALVAVFNYEKAGSEKAHFRSTMLEAIGIAALLSFITSSHTFGLLTELVIAFCLIVLVVVRALTERKGTLKPIHNAATLLLILLSLLMLGNSIYYIVTGFGGFATSHNAREFALPVLLTAMFLPFLYGLYVYATYDRVFNSFDFSVKDPLLRNYVRRKLITSFQLDTAGLEKWRRHSVIFEPSNKTDIDTSIREIKQVRKREKHPYRVPPTLGWLPNHATSFLASEGLATNDYHRVHGGWRANSGHLNVCEGILPSNVAYYVEGEEFVVSQLKLQLNVNAPETAEPAHKHFFRVISLLTKAAIPGALRNGNTVNIRTGDAPLLVNGYALALKHNYWPRGIKGGYDLVFTIEISEATAALPTS